MRADEDTTLITQTNALSTNSASFDLRRSAGSAFKNPFSQIAATKMGQY